MYRRDGPEEHRVEEGLAKLERAVRQPERGRQRPGRREVAVPVIGPRRAGGLQRRDRGLARPGRRATWP